MPKKVASKKKYTTRARMKSSLPSYVCDPTPVEVPLNAHKPISLQEEIKRFIQTEISNQADKDGHETFEEADDFEEDPLDADIMPLTAYELTTLQTDVEGPPQSLEGDPAAPPPENETALREAVESNEAPSTDAPIPAEGEAPQEKQNPNSS